MNIQEFKNDAELFALAGQRLVEMVTEFDARCLVLLSGGSAIASYQPLVELINSGQAKHVVIGLIDERYGPVGHDHSNARSIGEKISLWSACEAAGIEYHLPLQGLSLEQTALDYDAWLHRMLTICPIRIAVVGMGADGHTAGMFPMTGEQFDELFIQDEGKYFLGYSSSTEFDLRLTARVPLLQQMTRVLLIAAGKEKREVFNRAMELDELQEEVMLPISCLKYVVDAEAYIGQ